MIKIYKHIQDDDYDINLDVNIFNFPGGEVSVKLDDNNKGYWHARGDHVITATMPCAMDVMKLALVRNAILENCYFGTGKQSLDVLLNLPYLPYSRQDRVCTPGEAHGIGVFGEQLNAMKFTQISVVDPHSDVAYKCFDAMNVVSQFDVINGSTEFTRRILELNAKFVAPDAGAVKKASPTATMFDAELFVASKKRDTSNGNISQTAIDEKDFHGANLVILDDICEGGATFTALAKLLKSRNAGKIVLYVTHGIFSKGLKCLFDSGIDEVWTTDSYYGPQPPSNGCSLFNINYIPLKKHQY